MSVKTSIKHNLSPVVMEHDRKSQLGDFSVLPREIRDAIWRKLLFKSIPPFQYADHQHVIRLTAANGVLSIIRTSRALFAEVSELVYPSKGRPLVINISPRYTWRPQSLMARTLSGICAARKMWSSVVLSTYASRIWELKWCFLSRRDMIWVKSIMRNETWSTQAAFFSTWGLDFVR